MGSVFEMDWMIVPDGNQKRILETNDFILTMEHYHVFPIGQPVAVRDNHEVNDLGTAVIKKIVWENDRTTIVYELIDLFSVD